MKKMVFCSIVASSMLYASVYDLGRVETVTDGNISQNVGVSVVTSEMIQNTDSKTVSEAISNVPGVYINKIGGRGEETIRIRGFQRESIGFFIDGIPVYIPYDKRTDFARFTTFDLSAIDISKGYTSPLYGSSVMGGAVNLITKKPTREFEGEIGAGIYSGKGHEEFITLGTNQGTFYGFLSVSHIQRDYFKTSRKFDAQNSNQTDRKIRNSDRKDTKINLKVGYTPNDTDEYSFNYIRQRGEKGQPFYAGDMSSPIAFQTSRNWRWPDWNKDSYYLITKTEFLEKFALRTRWYRDEFKNTLEDWGTPNNSNLNWTSKYDDHSLGGMVEFDYKITDNQMLKVGVNQRYDYHKSNDDSKVNKDFLHFKAVTTSIGAEYTIKPIDELTWVLGGSWDHNKVKRAQAYTDSRGTSIRDYDDLPKNDSFNPQTALYYKFSDKTMVYASVSRKTNMPTLQQRYSSRFDRYIPNPDLKPEKSMNYEIGLEQLILENHMLKGAIFYTDTKDYITSVTVQPNPNRKDQAQNVGKEKQYGVEMMFESQWLPNLSTHLGYTYINAQIKNDPTQKYVTEIPKHSILAGVKYSPINPLDLIANLRYQSKTYASSEIQYEDYTNKSFTLVDLRVAYRVIKDLELAVGVKNLFDQLYYYAYGYPEEGRSYYASFRYMF